MKTILSVIIYIAFSLFRVFAIWTAVEVALVMSKGTPFHWWLVSALMGTIATVIIGMAFLFIIETHEYMYDNKSEEND